MSCQGVSPGVVVVVKPSLLRFLAPLPSALLSYSHSGQRQRSPFAAPPKDRLSGSPGNGDGTQSEKVRSHKRPPGWSDLVGYLSAPPAAAPDRPSSGYRVPTQSGHCLCSCAPKTAAEDGTPSAAPPALQRGCTPAPLAPPHRPIAPAYRMRLASYHPSVTS